MKKFKELTKTLNLTESEYVEGGGVQNPSASPRELSIHSDEGVHRVELDSQRKRIGAFLNAFGRKEYLDPKAALSILRSKLNIIGLDFDFNPRKNDCEVAMQTGEPMVYRLTRFGGVFGTSPDHDLLKNGFINSDGISDARNGVGLNLIIDVQETPNGLFKLDINIKDTMSETEETEEVDDEEVTPEEE
jgi:hypothetical protein